MDRANFTLRPHCVRHMIEEGFNESDLRQAVASGSVLELYQDDHRCLIAGKFPIGKSTSENLHIIADFWPESDDIDWVDIVTAYIPQKPQWLNAYTRGRIIK